MAIYLQHTLKIHIFTVQVSYICQCYVRECRRTPLCTDSTNSLPL